MHADHDQFSLTYLIDASTIRATAYFKARSLVHHGSVSGDADAIREPSQFAIAPGVGALRSGLLGGIVPPRATK